jgi:hypothetical protein
MNYRPVNYISRRAERRLGRLWTFMVLILVGALLAYYYLSAGMARW